MVMMTASCSEIERTYDCYKICDKYSGCFDEELDVSKCVDTCEDKGEEDPDFEAQAKKCEECVSDKACSKASTECLATCAEVVVVSTK